jgi:3-oxoacyl-[acyl-carrier protein] reductase
MGKLDGKVAIVTGSARGIGRGYARRLASLGAKVAVVDINLRSYAEFAGEAAAMTADSTVEEIRAGGSESLGFELDVGDRDAVFAMVGDVAKAWGRVDILVANAGGGRGSIAETQATTVAPELIELVTRMNLFGTMHSCAAVAPHMKEQRWGRIVTVASIGGIHANVGGGYAHYGANKAAIAHYTRFLAQELGPYGINCNCIAPGVIETARIVQLLGKHRGNNEVAANIALRRHGTPEDCAKVVEFLCTDLSDYVTGVLIPVDGGSSIAGGAV